MSIILRRVLYCLLLSAWLAPFSPPFSSAQAAAPSENVERAEPPRGYAFLSARVFNHFVQMPVVHQMAIQESVLGAWTEGTQSTRGLLTMRSVPDTQHGAFEFRLLGQSRCDDSVSRKGPATVYASAVTELDARVRLVLANDMFQVESIDAHGSTQSQLHDVQTRGPLLDAVAWRRANKKLPAVEQEVSRMSEERLTSHLRKEIDALLLKVNGAIASKAKQPLHAAGAWPQFRFATDDDGLTMQAFSPGPARRISTPPPAGWNGDADLALCVHDSLLEQMVDRLLGGKEISDDKVLQVMEMITGTAPRPLWVHDRSERWSIKLADQHPMRIAFRDGGIQVVVAVAETVRGETRSAAPAHVSAAFDVVTASDGPVLTRRGPLQVEMLTAECNEQSESNREFLASKFGGIFAEEIGFDTLAPPAGGYGAKMRQVRPKSYAFADGWATIHYVLQLQPTPPEKK